MSIRGVLFDIGGVVVGSPLHAIAHYERELGLAPNSVNRVVVDTGRGGAWSRLERGELALDAFYPLFEADCRESGGFEIDAARMFEHIGEFAKPRPRMLAAIGRIRARGLRAGALTNNWVSEDERRIEREVDLKQVFDVFVESSVVGLRKPDPAIYELACRELGVAPEHTAFLDDIGANLKSARALGLTTLKVDDPDVALDALSELLGFEL